MELDDFFSKRKDEAEAKILAKMQAIADKFMQGEEKC